MLVKRANMCRVNNDWGVDWLVLVLQSLVSCHIELLLLLLTNAADVSLLLGALKGPAAYHRPSNQPGSDAAITVQLGQSISLAAFCS